MVSGDKVLLICRERNGVKVDLHSTLKRAHVLQRFITDIFRLSDRAGFGNHKLAASGVGSPCLITFQLSLLFERPEFDDPSVAHQHGVFGLVEPNHLGNH